MSSLGGSCHKIWDFEGDKSHPHSPTVLSSCLNESPHNTSLDPFPTGLPSRRPVLWHSWLHWLCILHVHWLPFLPPKARQVCLSQWHGSWELGRLKCKYTKKWRQERKRHHHQVPLSFHLGTYTEPPHQLQTDQKLKGLGKTRLKRHPKSQNSSKVFSTVSFGLANYSVLLSLIQANLSIMLTSMVVIFLNQAFGQISALNNVPNHFNRHRWPPALQT